MAQIQKAYKHKRQKKPMPISLEKKYHELQTEGIESIKFSKGFTHCYKDASCTLTLATHTILNNKKQIEYGTPCISMIFKYTCCRSIGQGTATELLECVKNGNLQTENNDELIHAIECNQILYIPAVQGVLYIAQKIEPCEQELQDHQFYSVTQREEVISDMTAHIKKCARSLFKGLEQRDLFAIATFISEQFP